MSGRYVSLLAIVPMLIHSIWGCCWHHDHAASEHVQLVSATAQLEYTHCPSHSGHSHGHEEVPSEEPCDQEPCDQEPCALSSLSLTTVSQVFQFNLLGIVSYAVIEVTDLLKPQQTVASTLLADSPPISNGERRALTQVWLI